MPLFRPNPSSTIGRKWFLRNRLRPLTRLCTVACSCQVEMSERHGLGSDEFEGSAYRGVDGSSRWAADGWVRDGGPGSKRAANASAVVAPRRWWWGRPDPSCTWPAVEQRFGVSCFREYTLKLIRRQYWECGPTLAAEVLEECHEMTAGQETVRKWRLSKHSRRSSARHVSRHFRPATPHPIHAHAKVMPGAGGLSPR